MNIDDVKHDVDDFLDDEDSIDQHDVSTDDQSTDFDENQDDESDDLLDDLSSERERQKQNQIQAQVRKIREGKVTLADIEKNNDLKWLAPFVKKELENDQNSNNTSKEELIRIAREEAKRLLQEEKESMQQMNDNKLFQELKEKVKSFAPTREQREILKSEYNDLVDRLGKYAALQKAIKIAQINLDESVDYRKRQVPSVKSGWGSTKQDDYDFTKMDPNKLTPDERQKYVMQKKYGGKI